MGITRVSCERVTVTSDCRWLPQLIRLLQPAAFDDCRSSSLSAVEQRLSTHADEARGLAAALIAAADEINVWTTR
jgi:hypothetical protein